MFVSQRVAPPDIQQLTSQEQRNQNYFIGDESGKLKQEMIKM